jgi:hypothetical protein
MRPATNSARSTDPETSHVFMKHSDGAKINLIMNMLRVAGDHGCTMKEICTAHSLPRENYSYLSIKLQRDRKIFVRKVDGKAESRDGNQIMRHIKFLKATDTLENIKVSERPLEKADRLLKELTVSQLEKDALNRRLGIMMKAIQEVGGRELIDEISSKLRAMKLQP